MVRPGYVRVGPLPLAREFDEPIADPGYHEVFGIMENSPKPVIVAMRGTAPGAGRKRRLPVMLCCRQRGIARQRSLWVLFPVQAGLSVCRVLLAQGRTRIDFEHHTG